VGAVEGHRTRDVGETVTVENFLFWFFFHSILLRKINKHVRFNYLGDTMIETLLLLFFLFLAILLVVKVGFGIIKYLVANAVIGLLILWFTNWIGLSDVPLTALNVLVVAIGGILGVIALIVVYWF